MMRWSRPIRFPRRKSVRHFGGRKWRRTFEVEALEDRLAPATIQAISVADLSLGGTSITPNGPSVLQDTFRPHNSVSADGRYLAFLSSASNIVPGDNNNTYDVFVRDTVVGKTILVSVNSSGTGSANNGANYAVISANGRYVAFRSFATDLVAGMADNNNTNDVFVRDLQTSTTTVVSVNSAGTGAGNGASSYPVITPDGRYVVFFSSATDLVPGLTNTNGGVFIRDLVAGTTRLVSINNAGTGAGNGSSDYWQVTPDGRYVAFDSYASDLVSGDTNGFKDVFVRDLVANTTTLVSVNGSGTGSGNNTSQYPVISDDGRYVAFESFASNLGPFDNNSTVDVYVRDLVAGTTRFVSASSNAAYFPGDLSSDNPIISSNGRYVAFESISDNLVSGDNNNTWDVFVRDLTTNTTTLVSVASSGTGTANGQSAYPVMTPDGRYVAFQSLATNLTADSVSGKNVFLRDLVSGTTTLVSPNDNDTSADNNADTPMISNDGQHVAFMSYSSTIVGGDNNGFRDDFLWSNVAPAATKFVVSDFSSPSTAGVAGSFTVTAEDSNGNVATGYIGTVHFTSSDGQAVLPADYGFSATDAGQHTFSAILKTVGSQSLTVSDALNPGITGSQTGITVNPAAANSLVIAGFPSPTTAGVSANFTVIAKDPFGNIATGYTGTVHFTSSDPQAALPADYTFTSGDAGQHNFNAAFKTSGSQSLTVTDTATNSITGSQAVTVNPAAASSLVLVGFPAPIYAGASRYISATAKDPFGNVATGYTGTVHFTSSDPLAVLSADYTFTNANAGVYPYFFGTLKTAGTQSITAQDTANASITGSLAGITVNAPAITPMLIRHINTHTLGSNPQDYVSMGGFTYFTASDEQHGMSIWRTDGTSISLVADGRSIGQPHDLTNVNGTLFFATGGELWKTDGTTVSRVAIINPYGIFSDISQLTAAGGTLYFAANDAKHGFQLWKSDGTTAQLVTNTVPQPLGFGPQYLTNVNGTLFFEDLEALWETDATSAHMVATFNASNPDISFLTSFSGAVYFRADDGVHGVELWKTNGTVTSMVADINPGSGSSNPHALIAVNSTLFFAASDNGFDDKLWKTDGNTFSLVSSMAVPDISDQVIGVNGILFFAGFGGTVGDELWKTDGTTTTLVADINPNGSSYAYYLTNVNGTLYFSAAGGSGGRQLWKSDGTTATLVADINPVITFPFPPYTYPLPNPLVDINGALFFAADDGVHGDELWTSDGTAAGTRLFQDIELFGAGSDPRSMTNFNREVFFSADDGVHGYELWKTDGVHTTMYDLNPGPDGSRPNLLTVFNGQLYFEAFDDVNGPELWKTDGTTASIVNFGSGIDTSPNLLTVVNGWLFFSANDQNFGRQLWKTDGTTVSMVNINPTGQANPLQLVVVGNHLDFLATDGIHGYQLWTTDGTTTTMLPADFSNVGLAPTDNLPAFVNLNGTLFFPGNDGVNGTELWKTDGTTVSMVADINPGSSSSNPRYLTVANGLVFFVANDGSHGNQLWQSDGTTTKQVTNISWFANDSPIFLTAVNNALFFEADDPVNGSALWETTGNVATVVGSYSPSALTAINGVLYFEAYQQTNPFTLWKTDGTTTSFVADLSGVTVQDTFLDVSNTLFFEGSGADDLFEPWKLALPPLATKFVVTGFSSPATAGVPGSFTVTAEDANGNLAASYSGTVHFTSSDAQAVLPADYTFTSVDAGQHTFSATFKTAGSQSLTDTDTVTNTITGSQTGITVNAAATASFVVAGYPSPITAGTSHTFTVTATDPFGNLTAGYNGTVHFTSSDLKAALPANYTFTAGDSGVHTFSATLRTAGSQSITAKDTVTSSITGSQAGITVNPGAANHLILSRFPSVTTAGVAQSFRITAQDLYGNTVKSFTDTVAFSSTDGHADLPMNYMFTSVDMGVHNFLATLKTVGTQSLTAKDNTNTTVASATMSGITVNPAATSQFQISGFPPSVTAGTAYGLTVTALDPYGNVTPGYRGTVHFTSSDGAANLPSNYTYASGDAGVHNFMATLNTGGTQSITVADTVNSSINGTQSGISVVTIQPTAGMSGPSAGVPGQPLTYTLTASESGLPANTIYSFSIQWGDGSPVQALSGVSGTQVGHVFTTTGTFAVSLTATDPSGNASVPATLSVAISTVLMETDPLNSSQTALYVGGTTGNDTIAVTPVVNNGVNNGVKVAMNFVGYGSFVPTGHVVVYGQSGNDIIKAAALPINGVLTYVNVPLLIFAGNGNDILNVLGSMAGNVLVGGAGSDNLYGGLGRDIEIGGSGPSTLRAGSGGDILIGGTTDFDNNAAALAAVLAEWGRTDADYATRIAHLNGSMSGGLNGSVLLNPSTVHADGMANSLFGGAGMDWFFAGMMDALVNQTSGEVRTSI